MPKGRYKTTAKATKDTKMKPKKSKGGVTKANYKPAKKKKMGKKRG